MKAFLQWLGFCMHRDGPSGRWFITESTDAVQLGPGRWRLASVCTHNSGFMLKASAQREVRDMLIYCPWTRKARITITRCSDWEPGWNMRLLRGVDRGGTP